MSKDGMSKEGRKILPLQVTHNTESDCKDRLKFVRRKHVPVEVVLLILVIDPNYFYRKISLLA